MGLKEKPAYRTRMGQAYCIDYLEALAQMEDDSINLVITSPPFALQRPKEYGNMNQDAYIEWLSSFARLVRQKLVSDGSFVLDLGGAYKKGVPVRSLYNYKILIKFCEEIGFYLAEEFFWNNPSKLPSPIEWVNKRKIRAKDSVNTVWWLSKSEWPKSDISKVLVEYSPRMKKLLKNPGDYYSASKRPSGHDISNSFGKDNGGAIPSNLLQIPNSEASSRYLSLCKNLGIQSHPARFPAKLPEFFIKFLTTSNDLVVDIFSGSNTTGSVAELLGRRWLAFEDRIDYVAASSLRFIQDRSSMEEMKNTYENILQGFSVDIEDSVVLNES